jgi:AcrR family transcriptional regulator
MSTSKRRKASALREHRRKAVTDRILDAFERVVVRDGAMNIGANAVMKEAGMAKPLLYKYFGGMPGLVREWGRRRPFWPTHEELTAGDEALYETGDTKEQIKRRLVRLANFLRNRPMVLEILTAELGSLEPEVAAAFSDVRSQRGESDRARFRPDHEYLERDNFRLIHVMFAAVVYFALRTRRNPRLQGIQLDTDEGWEDTLAMIEEIIEDSVLAAGVRRITRKSEGRS